MPVYKSFKTRPIKAVNNKNEPVNIDQVLNKIKKDVEKLTLITEWHLSNDKTIREDINDKNLTGNTTIHAKIGERLNIKLPPILKATGKSGHSRYERMFQDRVVREADSWAKRSNAANGSHQGHMSAGWKRTASDIAPSDLNPKMSLSAAGDELYVKILDDPFNSNGYFRMKIVADGDWYTLTFPFDTQRFEGAKKLCLPDVYVDKKGTLRFSFAVEYEYFYASVSSDYILGVDVGITEPATISVISVSTGEIVHTTNLSRRLQSLKNSINASNRQKNSLKKLGREQESAWHRQAAMKKKRELAILIGQEVADLAHAWDNALVVVEDLSWIKNTMDNGRWNRGEVVKWITHFCNINGGLVYTANSAFSSQVCHLCHEKGSLDYKNRTFTCSNSTCANFHIVFDRDINAAAEIASRKVRDGSLKKTINTRKKSKKYQEKVNRRTAPTRQVLKYPGRDRTKTGVTPKRARKKKTGSRLVKLFSGEVFNTISAAGRISCTVSADARENVSRGTETGRTSYANSQRRAFYSRWLK